MPTTTKQVFALNKSSWIHILLVLTNTLTLHRKNKLEKKSSLK